MIALVGFMGAGKSTVGALLAERLGLPFVDTDALVEARAGRAIAEIFEKDGEAAFRRLESDVAVQALTGDDAVVALGGGALDDERTRAVLDDVTVVYLRTSLDEALRRVGSDEARPMLKRSDIDELYERRTSAHESAADVTIDTGKSSPDDTVTEVAAQIAERTSDGSPARVGVHLGSRSYDVWVGTDLASHAADQIPADAERVVVITHPELESLASPLLRELAKRTQVDVLTVPEGEGSKSWAEASRLQERIAALPGHRKDVVVAFGGGVIGDLAGFVASTYARGLRFVQVPTSLLAQVDAAIGGKTGVNLPQGKNLVGSFHQPLAVVADVRMLRTLPDEELRSGLAEVVKYGLISDPSLLELIATGAGRIFDRDEVTLTEVVRRSAAIKAAIVSDDEREQGKRAWLNYGHTLGHAIEQARSFEGIRHGEAVALGMMAAAYIAEDTGRIDEEAVALHRTTLEAVGLPVRASLELGVLQDAMARDKKYEGGIRFVLLEGIGRPQAGVLVDADVIERALKRMAE